MQPADLNEFQSYSIDSRTLQPGDVFVALRGPNFDGHDFIQQAEQKGAAAAIVEHSADTNLPLIQVTDSFQAFCDLAERRRAHVTIPIMAITGSCGKTTTKQMLANIMQSQGPTLATEKNLNNNLGVPLTLLRLTPEHKYAVIEVGANQSNEIAFAANIARPDVAVITNAAPVHIEGFGDLDGVARVKGDLVQNLTTDGIAVLNADDHYYDYWRSLAINKRVISFAIDNKADIRATNITTDTNGNCSFQLQTPVAEQKVHLTLAGLHNVKNALAAAAATYAVGVEIMAIKTALEHMPPVAKRMIKKQGKHGVIIIDDSYNANPSSMQAAMQVLLHGPGKKIMVIGDMAELGEHAVEYHRQLGEEAHAWGVDHLFAIGNLTKASIEAFGNRGQFFSERDELITYLNKLAAPDVTILVKGSNVNRMWEIVTALSR